MLISCFYYGSSDCLISNNRIECYISQEIRHTRDTLEMPFILEVLEQASRHLWVCFAVELLLNGCAASVFRLNNSLYFLCRVDKVL